MNTPSSLRHGLSLVEVLISIGVMAIGILGTAALLPIGGAEIAEAARLERGAAIGRAAYRDSLVRGIFRPEKLVNPDNLVPPDQFPWKDVWAGTPMQYPTDGGNSVCIDPLFWAHNFMMPPNAGNARFSQLPATVDNDSDLMTATGAGRIPRMLRATLASGNSNSWMSAAEADLVFRWHDDLAFQPFEEDDFNTRQLLPARPRQIFEQDGLALSGRTRQYTGDYSWMVTLTPAETEDPDPAAASARQLYTASFVVFHKRDLLAPQPDQGDRTKPPGEKVVLASYYNTSPKVLGGGTLILHCPDTVNTTDPEEADLPKLRANQWILLAGWTETPMPSQSALAASQPKYTRPVFKWYRVSAVSSQPTYVTSPPMPPGWRQGISVVGPDWDTDVVNADPSVANNRMLYAIVMDGVVGVYEKTIALQK